MHFSQLASATASSSRKATTWPVAAAIPVFRPPDRPCWWSFSITMASGSAAFSRSYSGRL